MGLEWKPRPNEPAPYRTEAETQAAGVPYVSEAAHYARVGNYNYGSDAFRLAELQALVAGRLTTDQVVIPPAGSSLVQQLVNSTPAAAAALAPQPPAAPATAPTSVPTGTGGLLPFVPQSPGVNTGIVPSSFTSPVGGYGTAPVFTAAGSGATFAGVPMPLVLVALAVAAYFLYTK